MYTLYNYSTPIQTVGVLTLCSAGHGWNGERTGAAQHIHHHSNLLPAPRGRPRQPACHKGNRMLLFGPNLFIFNWLCFKPQNRKFLVIHSLFTPYIYSESSYQKQSFKNDMYQLVKNDLKIIISWKNTYFLVKKSPIQYLCFRKCTLVCLYNKIFNFFTKWEPSQTFGHMQQTQSNKELFSNSFAISTEFFWITCIKRFYPLHLLICFLHMRFICLLGVAKNVKIQNRTVVYMGQYHKHAKHRLHLPSEHLSFESYYALDIRFIPMNGQ